MKQRRNPLKTERPFKFTDEDVDLAVNAVFTALTHELGRPFIAGGRRNVRSIVRTYCPLSQDDMEVDLDTWRASYLSAHFFDRFFYADEVRSSELLEVKAFEKFRANLSRGYRMNNFVLKYLPFGKLNSVIKSASLEASRILGELDYTEWFEECTHGPNATVGVNKHDAYLPSKVETLDGTFPALRLFEEYLEWNTTLGYYLLPRMASGEVVLAPVCGSRLSFVPKTFDSYRTMMIEPTVNQFFQQGLGKLMTKKLARFANVDLSTQDKSHQLLVNVITRHGLEIATLDWSQASDRIWLKLCQEVLPSDWYEACTLSRSPNTIYKGGMISLPMMGSMGNGFTFPLQTLIFLVLIRALARESGLGTEFVSVFGDDCICDSDLLHEVEWLARELDMQLNADKSFSTGDFRESCGCDSFRGINCRPFRIERPAVRGYYRHAIKAWAYGAYNQIKSAILPNGGSTPYLDHWIKSLFRVYDLGPIEFVPPRFSEGSGIRIPDPSVVDPLDGVYSNIRGNEYSGYRFSFTGPLTKRVRVNEEPYYIWALQGKKPPREFRKGVIPTHDEYPDDAMPDDTGMVPWKGVVYGTRRAHVQTWAYFID